MQLSTRIRYYFSDTFILKVIPTFRMAVSKNDNQMVYCFILLKTLILNVEPCFPKCNPHGIHFKTIVAESGTKGLSLFASLVLETNNQMVLILDRLTTVTTTTTASSTRQPQQRQRQRP